MRLKIMAVAAVAALSVALTGCGKSTSDSATSAPSVAKASFASGTKMEALNKAGSIKIGVKFDQPGLGYKDPAKGAPEGFDIEMGKIVAAKLGIPADKIEYVETVSKNREAFIQNGTVDIVIASYSITPERKQIVGMAGPYYVTGQQLLVRKDDSSIKGPENLGGKGVCSVTGSTSIKTVAEKYGATPKPFGTYSECVQALLNKTVDAVTTDGPILLGYAAQDPDKLKVVGEPFSTERYGIGYTKDDSAFCKFLTDTITGSFKDGAWKDAFKNTLGKAGVEAPKPPEVDACA